MKIVDTYTEGNFIVTKYDNGTTVKAIKCDDTAPIDPPKPPLSEIELAILDTAINTQYLVILTEMGF